MQIKAGKFYRTRDGRKVGPMVMDRLPFCSWHDGRVSTWNVDGYVLASADTEYPSDIVSEWIDAPATPKPLDVRPGDIVHVRMLKLEEEKQWVPCREDGRPCSTVEAVFHVEPRVLRVGDRVRMKTPWLEPSEQPVGTLKGVDGEDAWVRWDKGPIGSAFLPHLQPAGDAA